MLVPKVDGGVVGAVPLDVDNWYHRPSLVLFAHSKWQNDERWQNWISLQLTVLTLQQSVQGSVYGGQKVDRAL